MYHSRPADNKWVEDFRRGAEILRRREDALLWLRLQGPLLLAAKEDVKRNLLSNIHQLITLKTNFPRNSGVASEINVVVNVSSIDLVPFCFAQWAARYFFESSADNLECAKTTPQAFSALQNPSRDHCARRSLTNFSKLKAGTFILRKWDVRCALAVWY